MKFKKIIFKSKKKPVDPIPDPSEKSTQRTGTWQDDNLNQNSTCSECGKVFDWYFIDLNEWKYCPICGSRNED